MAPSNRKNPAVKEEEISISEEEEDVEYEEVEEEEEEVEEEEAGEEEEEVEEEEAGEEEEEVEEEVDEEVEEEEPDEDREEEEEEEQNPNQKPSVVESISRLQTLNGALFDFLSHYNSLQQTLDSVNSSINAIKPVNTNKPVKIEALAADDNNQHLSQQTLGPVNSSIPAIETGNTSTIVKIEAGADDRRFNVLKSICENCRARDMLRYMATHISDMNYLRRQVPEALKLVRDPAKFVLEAMGKFYLQGCRSYNKDGNLASVRRAAILLLELYMLAGFDEVPVGVQKDARDAAIAWRERLIREGGVECATAVDALGLTLLVGSFGVPTEFRTKELYSLIRLSNLKMKGDVLRRSHFLVRKIPGTINNVFD